MREMLRAIGPATLSASSPTQSHGVGVEAGAAQSPSGSHDEAVLTARLAEENLRLIEQVLAPHKEALEMLQATVKDLRQENDLLKKENFQQMRQMERLMQGDMQRQRLVDANGPPANPTATPDAATGTHPPQ